jgi:hypothetical protein
VKELRLAGISNIPEANVLLDKEYLPAVNGRFVRPASEPEDAHVPLIDSTDLRDIFCFEEPRKVTRDYVIQYGRRIFRVPRDFSSCLRPGDTIMVRRWLDGSVHHYWKGSPIELEEIIVKNHRKEGSAGLSA